MTELKRARAHLKYTQGWLYRCRCSPRSPSWIACEEVAERYVLAALSWVWEAQQQYLFQKEHQFVDEMRKLGADGPELNAAIQARRDALLTMGKHAYS